MGYPFQPASEFSARAHNLEIVRAHPDFAYYLGPRLRAVDTKEMLLGVKEEDADPSDILCDALGGLTNAYGVVESGTLRALWGHERWITTCPEAPNGIIWLVSDDDLFKRGALEMTKRFTKVILPDLLDMYGSVGNYIMEENTAHVRWLQACGFQTVGDTRYFGQPFLLMVKD